MIKKKPKIPQSVLYSDAFDERKLYNTREELMNAELKERETGRIKWKNFDRLVAEARQKIEEEIAASRAERQRKEEEKKKEQERLLAERKRKQEERQRLLEEERCKRQEQKHLLVEQYRQQMAEQCTLEEKYMMVYGLYVYNLTTNELIGEYASVSTAASALDLSARAIYNSLYFRNGEYKKCNMRFVKKDTPQLIPIQTKSKYICCVYNLFTNELLGEYANSYQASLAFGLPRNTASNSIVRRNGVYKKAGLLFTVKYV